MQAAETPRGGPSHAAFEGAVIFVVDDDRDFRATVRLALETAGHRVSTHGSAEEFLAAVDEDFDADAPNCLLLDLRLPGSSGLFVQEELRRRGIELPVIFLTGYGEIPTAVRALKQGAHDFLQKPFEESVLLERIALALARVEATRAAQQRSREIVARHAALSPREREVMRRMVDGQASKVMAAELDLSLKTIELHRRNVMQKMAVDSIPALVEAAIEIERSGSS